MTIGGPAVGRAVPTALAVLFLIAAGASAAEGNKSADEQKPPVHKITQSPSYIMIDPIYTSITDHEHPEGLLMVGVGLDVPNPDLRSQVQQLMPVLRDAYVRTLLAYTATSVRAWRQPDVADIADRLQRVTDGALGRRGARLLLAQVAMRLTH